MPPRLPDRPKKPKQPGGAPRGVHPNGGTQVARRVRRGGKSSPHFCFTRVGGLKKGMAPWWAGLSCVLCDRIWGAVRITCLVNETFGSGGGFRPPTG